MRVRSPHSVTRMSSAIAACFLFAPATDGRKVASALRSGADAVILDLEGSIPPGSKAAARASIARAVVPEQTGSKQTGSVPEVWVRVNVGGPDFDADVAGIDWSSVTGVVLPRAEDPERVRALAAAGAARALLLIESAVGVHAMERLARSSPIVERLAIGTYDLALDLGLLTVSNPDESELMWQVRGQMVLESRRLSLRQPVDGVYGELFDAEGLRAACVRAHRLGFGGKLLVHPRQIEVARSVFCLDPAAVEDARQIVESYDRAAADGRGAISLNGRLVDQPMVERAKALLARAGAREEVS